MSPAATAATRRARAAPAPARRVPARRSSPRRRSASRAQPRSAPAAHLIPLAAARTAGAVGDIADSGLMVRLTRGRWWIALLAALLAGIVALNVASLSISSSASRVAERSEELKQANSVLEAQLAKELSSQRVKSIAAGLGFEIPYPEEVVYLSPDERDPQVAARRLQAGEVGGPTDLADAPVPSTDQPAAP